MNTTKKEEEDKKVNDTIVEILLSEFNSLKSEIANRSQSQTNIITLNITILGAIGGVFLSNKVDVRVLFVIPIISTILGILYVDHAINIGNIGRFIQNEIKPKIASLLNERRIIDYESYVRNFEKKSSLRIILLGLPIFMIFGGIPMGTMLLPIFLVKSYDLIFWSATILSGILVFSFIWLWFNIIIMSPKIWQTHEKISSVIRKSNNAKK